MLGLLSYALKRVIIELCQEKSSNHEKHGWNFYAKVVFLQPLFGNFYLRAIILGENIKLLDIYFINAYNIVEQTLVKYILVKHILVKQLKQM